MTAPALRRAGEGIVEHWDDDRGRLRFTTMIGAVAGESGELTSGTCTVPPGGFLADGPDPFEFVFTYAADSLQDPRVAYR